MAKTKTRITYKRFCIIMKKENIDFGEALRLLAQKAGIDVPTRFEPDVKKDERERLYQVNQAAAQYFHNVLLNADAAEKARKYVAGRGLSAKTVVDFQLGFSPNSWDSLKNYMKERGYAEDELLAVGLVIETEAGESHDRFRNRLVFPIQDIRGHVVGFGARVLDDSLPKYLNSPQTLLFNKSGCLYGINLAAAAIRQQDLAVIVEGYMDVITAYQNGFKNMIASMGTAVTEKQINSIKELGRDVVFALDADAAGEEAMLRAVGYENTIDAEIRVAILPEGEDPDSLIRKDNNVWRKLLQEAVPIVDYTFNMVTAELDLNTAKDKSAAVDKLGSIVNGMQDKVRKVHYLQKLAHLVNISQRDLEAVLGRTKPGRVERRAKELRQARVTQSLSPFLSNPVEEYCLALLLQNPELKDGAEGLIPEYFENSENREIFTIWQKTSDSVSLKDRLDGTIWENLDSLIARKLPVNQIEQRYADCVLRLRERYLRTLELKRGEVLALEAESGGTTAELAKLEEQGIEISVQLGELFTQKARESRNKGGKNDIGK